MVQGQPRSAAKTVTAIVVRTVRALKIVNTPCDLFALCGQTIVRTALQKEGKAWEANSTSFGFKTNENR
jgi:hypothetical protein